MLQDARQVFFSMNRVIQYASIGNVADPCIYRKDRFGAAIYLTTVMPSDSLKHLRDLELHFSPKDYSHLGIDPEALDDWDQAVKYATQVVTNLTLTLYLARELTATTHDMDGSIQELLTVHEQILLPIRQLQPNLKAFFVFADDPFHKTAWDAKGFEPLMQRHEKQMENLVMGTDYDGIERGKPRRHKSRWLCQPIYAE